MQSDQIHMDDYFRKKEASFMPDNDHIEKHWQQMKTMLAAPAREASVHNLFQQVNQYFARYFTRNANNPVNKQQNDLIAVATNKEQNMHANKTTKPVSRSDGQFQVMSSDGKMQSHLPEYVNMMIKVYRNKDMESGNAHKTPAQQLFYDFYEQLQKEEELFTIPSEKDAMILAKEGTRLFIPAYTLADDGQFIKGPVTIHLREYYRYDHIIAARLNTTSNNRPLATGGMLQIRASFNGKAISKNMVKSMTINMPAMPYDDRMQLFIGVQQGAGNNNINWQPVQQQQKRSPANSYQFMTRQMGWLNCDRFVDTPAKTSCTVYLPEGLAEDAFSAQLAFTRYASVIPGRRVGNTIKFVNISENEPAQLICTGVREQQMVYCMQPLTTSQKKVGDLVFQPVAPEQFKKQLEMLVPTP